MGPGVIEAAIMSYKRCVNLPSTTGTQSGFNPQVLRKDPYRVSPTFGEMFCGVNPFPNGRKLGGPRGEKCELYKGAEKGARGWHHKRGETPGGSYIGRAPVKGEEKDPSFVCLI